jgi:dTDP-4-dehydrorhamnose 3,5-epimerase
MIFEETPLRGAYVIHLEPRGDARGFFARSFCQREFEARGLKGNIAQANIASTRRPGTIRGLHYQVPPHAEAKLFRCTRGANFHVMVDLRPDSPTRFQHFGVVLSDENRKALYVPELFAHGYQAQSENAEAMYHVSEFYQPGAERGLRYNDPHLGIAWPLPATEVSSKDLAWPLLGSTENNKLW